MFLRRAGLQTCEEEVPSLLRATASSPAAASWPSAQIRLVWTSEPPHIRLNTWRSSLFCVCNRVCCVSGGGGMVGLSSVNAASDGKWTVTQISCHAGEILTNTGLTNTLGSFNFIWSKNEIFFLEQIKAVSRCVRPMSRTQFTKNKSECLRPIWVCPNSISSRPRPRDWPGLLAVWRLSAGDLLGWWNGESL